MKLTSYWCEYSPAFVALQSKTCYKLKTCKVHFFLKLYPLNHTLKTQIRPFSRENTSMITVRHHVTPHLDTYKEGEATSKHLIISPLRRMTHSKPIYHFRLLNLGYKMVPSHTRQRAPFARFCICKLCCTLSHLVQCVVSRPHIPHTYVLTHIHTVCKAKVYVLINYTALTYKHTHKTHQHFSNTCVTVQAVIPAQVAYHYAHTRQGYRMSTIGHLTSNAQRSSSGSFVLTLSSNTYDTHTYQLRVCIVGYNQIQLKARDHAPLASSHTHKTHSHFVLITLKKTTKVPSFQCSHFMITLYYQQMSHKETTPVSFNILSKNSQRIHSIVGNE